MLYFDTGCLVKLYYPEVDSPAAASAARGQTIAFTALHELELVSALHLKVFRGEAREDQVSASIALVEADVASGVLTRVEPPLTIAVRDAIRIAARHASTFGCRSLDVLHCALARQIRADRFITTDARQLSLARAESLPASSL